MSENLDVFLTGLDAVDVTVYLPDDSTRSFKDLFDNSFFNTQLGEIILETTKPRLTCKAVDVAGIPRESYVVLNGDESTYYSIIQFQPEGTGMMILILAIEPNGP